MTSYTTLGGRVTCTQCNALSKRTRQRCKAPAVKGKTKGVKIYTVGRETEHHRQFLEAYYSGDWDEALKRLDDAMDFHPEFHNYYVMMKKRLALGKPEDWSGTYRATTK